MATHSSELVSRSISREDICQLGRLFNPFEPSDAIEIDVEAREQRDASIPTSKSDQGVVEVQFASRLLHEVHHLIVERCQIWIDLGQGGMRKSLFDLVHQSREIGLTVLFAAPPG